MDIVEEEKPDKQDVTFMLQPAPSTRAGGRSGMDETMVIFCVDTSGSMCVTTEVGGGTSVYQGRRRTHSNLFI